MATTAGSSGTQQGSKVKEMAMAYLALLKEDEPKLIRKAKQLIKKRKSLARQVITMDVDGWTPIHACALRGTKALLKVMLSAGIDINLKMGQPEGLPCSCAILHMAALRGDWKIVEVLISRGANINARDSCGRTPVMYAAGRKHRRIVRRFEEYGADMTGTEIPVNSKDNDSYAECITPQPSSIKFCFF